MQTASILLGLIIAPAKTDKVITIWYVTKRKKYKSTIFQILASVKKILHATRMLDAKTPLDHMYVNVTLDILEMDKTAQANLISLKQYLD